VTAPDAPAAAAAAVSASADQADLVVALLTYNNADPGDGVTAAAAGALAGPLADVSAALVNADAGSADDTVQRLAAAGPPVVGVPYQVPAGERVTVPFHGTPGRGAALRAVLEAARRLGARALVMLEADCVTVSAEWIERLARPILDAKADFVSAAYARHRYDGTITKLLLSPLVRALYGRRLHQPFGGQLALSSRLVEHLLVHPKWDWRGRDVTDLWIAGTAIADGFAVWEAWLGRHAVRSRTRTTDLPTMTAQTVGAVFTVMDRHEDLWREVRGSEPLPAVGDPATALAEPTVVDVERMLDGFRRGTRDLVSIWEHVLAADTLGEVLSLDADAPADFVFPDALWARVVYDFALGHHYGVVHRDHLLRSLVPLYLGRTAAYVAATQRLDGAGSDAALERVAEAFEGEKPYLVEHWR
jgi:hypothetical protein